MKVKDDRMKEKLSIEKDNFSVDSLPFGIVYTDEDFKVLFKNYFIKTSFLLNHQELINIIIKNEFDESIIEDMENGQIMLKQYTLNGKRYDVQIFPSDTNSHNRFIICIYPEKIFEVLTNRLKSYKNLEMDLQAIFETSYDVIFVTDGEGNTLRASQACESLWGIKREEIIGRNVLDLEKEGVFTPSIIRLVLEKKEEVTSLQYTKTGKRLIVTGTPIKDDNGNIIRVINISRDITAVDQLQDELDSTNKKMEGYKAELKKTRVETNEKYLLVYRSANMRSIVTLAKKVAEVNSTVLLEGETGVGKRVLASYIHNQGLRKKNPFISINCSSLSEGLMLDGEIESRDKLQLGISKKLDNLFELANEGTIFLEEVNELSLSAQVSLQRILSNEKNTDVRVIVSSSKNLQEEVTNLAFRKDLFYHLNVIPIKIPPLRLREEDILPLSQKFIKEFNKEYGLNKKLGHDIIDVFIAYEWPGNVTELRNIIERLIVTTDKALIEKDMLPSSILRSKDAEKSVEVRKILPLKEAIESLEKDLISLALSEHASTTKVAEMLQVNQSTISRKIAKYFKDDKSE